MTDRAPTPELRPDRVEAVLPWGLRGSLYDLCAAFGVSDPSRWPDHPLLCDLLTLAAASTLRARKERAGLSRTRALRAACEELGLHFPTVQSRLARARKRYLDARSCAGKSPRNDRIPALRSGEKKATSSERAA